MVSRTSCARSADGATVRRGREGEESKREGAAVPDHWSSPAGASVGERREASAKGADRLRGSRTGTVGCRFGEPDHAAGADGRQRAPLRAPLERRHLAADEQQRGWIAVGDRLERDRRRRYGDVGEDVAPAGQLQQLAHEAAGAERDDGLVPRQEQRRRGRAIRRRGHALRRQRTLERGGDRVARDGPAHGGAEDPGGVRDIGQPVGAELEHGDAQLAEPGGGGGVPGGLVQHHEVRLDARHYLHGGRKSPAQIGHRGGLRGVVAGVAPADEAIPCADGEEQLGGRGIERDDALRWGGRGRAPGRPARREMDGRKATEEERGARERALQARRPSSGFRRWAIAGRDSGAGVATVPSPEGSRGGASERSPGFGPSLAFPVSQWRT